MLRVKYLQPERYRYSVILLRQLVKTEFKLRYQGSVLGYLWSLLKPLALFVILLFVFSNFLRVGASVEHFPVYLLLGVVLWTYFVEVTSSSVTSIVDRGDILRKVNFPRYTIVVAASFSALINLFINLGVVGIFMVFSGVGVGLSVLWLPLIIIQLFIFSLAIAFFLSAAYVRFRDISHIWEVFMQGAFYATPILYPVSFISDYSELAPKIIMLNPVAQIIQDARYVLVTDEATRIDQVFDGHMVRFLPYGLTILFAIIAVQYFRSQSRYFAEEL